MLSILSGLSWLAASIHFLAGGLPAFPAGKFSIENAPSGVQVRNRAGHLIVHYQPTPPAGSGLSVASGCFFHPVSTPSGVVLTDLAPSDHKHHRGIFLAWVEMRGTRNADFWGWGEPAPKEGRVIRNKKIDRVGTSGTYASFRAENEWTADSEVLVREQLETVVRSAPDANVIELTYTLTPTSEIQLARWAFGGFCVRLRKDGTVEASDSRGKVALPDPAHTKPESDWPDSSWYDFTVRLADGKEAGIAVIQHPGNPPTLWHNHRSTRMINPCITAPGEVRLDPRKPLVLRYRVVAHDGPPPRELLDRLVREWGKS